MSHKAFYQTFYQTEHLFRLPDDPLSFGQQPLAVIEEPVARLPVVSVEVPPVRLPVVPVEVPVVEVIVLPVDVPVVEVPAPQVDAPVVVALPAVAVETPVVPVVLAEPGEVLAPVVRPMAPEPVRPASRPVPTLQHRVLIVVDAMPLPGELLFLQNVLKAVHLDADTVDLLNLPGWQGKDFRPILTDKQVDHFIIFGLSFGQLDLDIEIDLYHPVRFDGITFMRADAPGVIEGDRALKKRLWESLQRIFLRPRPQ